MSDSSNTDAHQTQSKELHRLLSAAIDGVLPDQQQDQLAELLQSNAKLRQEYVAKVANEALLEERLAKPLLEQMLGDAVSQATTTPEKVTSSQAEANAKSASS
ncbi:MAG: hypothetical protein RID07_00065, partial [Lacipirellulaceae bacterium]